MLDLSSLQIEAWPCMLAAVLGRPQVYHGCLQASRLQLPFIGQPHPARRAAGGCSVVNSKTLHVHACAAPQVLHFVGPRKKVLGLVHKAFMAGGPEGAYRMLSMLPHTEAELGALDVAAAEAALLPLATAAVASAA